MHLFHLLAGRRAGPLLIVASIVLPIVYGTGANGPVQEPGDLPARATLSAALYGTAQAQLEGCRQQHEAALIALQTAAAKLYLVQTVVAPDATDTPMP